jgi:hypothetical protein
MAPLPAAPGCPTRHRQRRAEVAPPRRCSRSSPPADQTCQRTNLPQEAAGACRSCPAACSRNSPPTRPGSAKAVRGSPAQLRAAPPQPAPRAITPSATCSALCLHFESARQTPQPRDPHDWIDTRRPHRRPPAQPLPRRVRARHLARSRPPRSCLKPKRSAPWWPPCSSKPRRIDDPVKVAQEGLRSAPRPRARAPPAPNRTCIGQPPCGQLILTQFLS